MKSSLVRQTFLLLLAALCAALPAFALDGVVVDAATGAPIAGAHVVHDGTPISADAQGRFHVEGTPARVSVRAAGYLRRELAVAEADTQLRVALPPFRPKALYLTPYGAASAELRGNALRLVEQTELNALVIDMKGDASLLPHASAAWREAGLGEPHPTVRDMGALVRELKARGLYLIARVVVFKDDRLVQAHPEWAVRDGAGAIWRDRERLAWIDPTRREAWALALGVAEEAARMGFDEVQFDYVRFPDTTGVHFAQPNTQAMRTATIGAFLDAARARLARYNVFIAADVFGYICWNRDDTHIGQQLESLAPRLDYVSPMLYPSGFTFGIPGHPNPVAAPYAIVYQSLARALERTGLPGVRFRPWLQAFRDYGFDRREFGDHEIRAQIDAAEAHGTDGWMLWNAGNRYDADGLKPRPSSP